MFYTHTHICVCVYVFFSPPCPFSHYQPFLWNLKNYTTCRNISQKNCNDSSLNGTDPPSRAIGMGSQRFPPFPTIGFRAVRDEEKFYLNQTTKTCISSLLYKTPTLLGSGSNCVFSCFLMHFSWIKVFSFWIKLIFFSLLSYLKVKQMRMLIWFYVFGCVIFNLSFKVKFVSISWV